MQKTVKMRQIDERLSVPAHTFELRTFTGATKYKSVWRAMRKGLVGRNGEVLPLRPFNNSKRTKGRKLQKDFEKASLRLKSYLKRAQEIDTENAKEKH
jgi:hypothetical protein